MALNREQKRQMRKSGDVSDDGEQSAPGSASPKASAKEPRVGAGEFIREVRSELRKVAWPTKSETLNYSLIVFITLVFLTGLVFAIDWVFSNAILKLFEVS